MTACGPTVALRFPVKRGTRQPRHQRLRPPLVSVRLVRQCDQLRDVGELRRERVEACVDLGRIQVARREVAEECLAHRRQAAAEPGLDGRLLRGAGARADPDQRRLRRRRRRGVADADEDAVFDVGIGRRVRVDVQVHRSRIGVDRGARTPVPREGQRRAGVLRAVHAREACLRLDREEPSGVVLERVDAKYDDLALVCRRDVLRGRVGLHLRPEVLLTVLHSGPPRCRAFDRRSQLVAGGRERVELVGRAEDGRGDGAVAIVPQIVVVEVDAVGVGVQLQLDRGSLAREMHLDEVPALVRVDSPSFALAGGCARGNRQSKRCDCGQAPPGSEPHVTASLSWAVWARIGSHALGRRVS